MLAQLYGYVRGKVVPNYQDGSYQAGLNNRGELAVVQGLPPRAEAVRLGQSWSMSIPTGSAFAPVAAWPTTLCNLYLFNNEPAGGMSYIIDTIWASAITSIAAASSFSLLAQLVPNGAAPTPVTTPLIVSRSGKPNYSGRAQRSMADTKAIASSWDVVAAMAASPSAAIGAGVFADVWGNYIVPPQSGFGINVVASTAAGTMIQGMTWTEAQLTLG